jgi:hypothetical protein
MKPMGIIKYLLFAFTLLLMPKYGKSQAKPSKLKEYLLNEKGLSNLQFHTDEKLPSSYLVDTNITNSLKLIPYQDKIIFKEEGGGRLFTETENKNLTRIDNTIYSGYNFGAVDIVYKDTLLSIGGYGFWNCNGSIRYFDFITREWNIIKTEKEIKFANGINAISFYYPKEEKLFIVYTEYTPEYIKTSLKKDEVLLQCLDLKNKSWLKFPLRINSKFATTLNDIKIINYCDKGLMVNSKLSEHTLLIDFINNKIFEVNDSKITSLRQYLSRSKNYLNYTVPGAIKIYDIKKDTTYQIELTTNDFIKTKWPFYENIEPKKLEPSLTWVLIIINIITLTGLIYLFKKTKKSKKVLIKEFENNDILINNEEIKIIDFLKTLTINERDTLKILTENAINNKKTSIFEINNVLGVSRKNYKIQNNIRAELLASINKKFMAFAITNDLLIIRERTILDKRFFEYDLNNKYSKKIKSTLSKFP